jgi:hypothetical protein
MKTAYVRLLVAFGAVAFVALCSPVNVSSAEPATNSTASPGQIRSSEEAAKVWEWVKESHDPSQLQKFIKTFPNSPYAQEAQRRLDKLAQPSTTRSIQTTSRSGPSNIVVAARSDRRDSQCWWFLCWFPVVHGVGY